VDWRGQTCSRLGRTAPCPLRGKRSTLGSGVPGFGPWYTVKVLLSGTTIKACPRMPLSGVWLDGTLKINTTDSDIAAGGFGLTATGGGKFRNMKIGYDNNADDDIADAGDDIVYEADLSTTSATVSYDKNGNLTDDGVYKYAYDAWNRLVKVTTEHDALTLATCAYDALGRRIKKVVSNSGDLDGTTYFYYNAKWQLLETRAGEPRTSVRADVRRPKGLRTGYCQYARAEARLACHGHFTRIRTLPPWARSASTRSSATSGPTSGRCTFFKMPIGTSRPP